MKWAPVRARAERHFALLVLAAALVVSVIATAVRGGDLTPIATATLGFLGGHYFRHGPGDM